MFRYVNRNAQGFVDFEKMLGLEGIALVNVVSNWQEASITGSKKLQTRITHNDGMGSFRIFFLGGKHHSHSGSCQALDGIPFRHLLKTLWEGPLIAVQQ